MNSKTEKLIKLSIININYQLMFFSGVLLILMGGTLNSSTIISNECKMPVYTDSFDFTGDKEYFAFTNKEEVNRFYFADIFVLNGFGYLVAFSVGDIIVLFGILIATGGLIKRYKIGKEIRCIKLERK